MTTNTQTAVKAILAADATITPDEIKSVIGTLTKRQTEAETGDRVISRAEVAAIMGKSVKAVDIYGRRGIIRRIYLTGGGSKRVQAQGYSRNSVFEAISREKPMVAMA